MSETITVVEAERRIQAAVAAAVSEAVATTSAAMRQEYTQQMLQLQQALEQAKRVIATLQTKLFGVRSESSQVVLTAEGQQFIDANWNLPQEAVPAAQAAQAVVVPEDAKTAPRKPRDGRGLAQRHPHLPVEETQAEIPAELAEQIAAGVVTAQRSGTFSDELVMPADKPFIRRVHQIEIVSVKTGATVLQVVPNRIVDDGDLADETIHRLVIGKFNDAMPFHRQLQQFERADVTLPKQTVNDAMNAWGEVFAPLAAAIASQIAQAPVVHADASWLRVQAKQQCKRVHLWTTLGGGQVAYRITPDLTHDRATEIIPKQFTGKIVTDAWPGWIKAGWGDRLFLCNAHARRPFADWLKRHPKDPNAQRIVELYRQLARIEHEPDALPAAERLERRRQLRQTRSRPLMDELLTTAQQIAQSHPHAHQLADGARYIIDYWDGLSRHLDHPDVPPDNNAAENALRINALIRKNSLFAGSDAAARRDAIALTVLHSCRLQQRNPADYLASVTPTLLRHRLGRPQDLAALTPANKAVARQATARG